MLIEEKMFGLDLSNLEQANNKAQGLDEILFDAAHAWATLNCLNVTQFNAGGPKSILGKSLYDGNALRLIISLYQLIDSGTINSIRNIWNKKALYKKMTGVCKAEGEYIHKTLQNPKDSQYLSTIITLRNKSFAHNEITVKNLDALEIEKCVQFCIRSYYLLQELVSSMYSRPFPLLNFQTAKLGMEKLFRQSQIDKMAIEWDRSGKLIAEWQSSKLDLK